VVTCREVIDYARRLCNDPAFAPHFSELVAFTADSDIRLGYLDWQSSADRDPFSNSSRRAFVLNSQGAIYGTVRMYQTARNDLANIRSFDTEDKALSWLPLLPEQIQKPT